MGSSSCGSGLWPMRAAAHRHTATWLAANTSRRSRTARTNAPHQRGPGATPSCARPHLRAWQHVPCVWACGLGTRACARGRGRGRPAARGRGGGVCACAARRMHDAGVRGCEPSMYERVGPCSPAPLPARQTHPLLHAASQRRPQSPPLLTPGSPSPGHCSAAAQQQPGAAAPAPTPGCWRRRWSCWGLARRGQQGWRGRRRPRARAQGGQQRQGTGPPGRPCCPLLRRCPRALLCWRALGLRLRQPADCPALPVLPCCRAGRTWQGAQGLVGQWCPGCWACWV